MSPGAVDPRSTAFLGRWVLYCGAAELVGVAAGAAWWLAWDWVNPEPATLIAQVAMLGAKGLSGVVEGVILGLVQSGLLRRLYPRLDRRAWIVATATMAVMGWLVGSSFAILGVGGAEGSVTPDPGPLTTVLLAGSFGFAVGAVFGMAQSLVLRKVVGRGWIWVGANAAGWALALPGIYLAASADAGAATLLLAAASGVVAGLILGLVTGVALRWMPARETTR